MLLNRERAHRIMEEEGVEAIIATMPENVVYVSDFWSLAHWLLKGVQTYAVLPREEKIAPFVVTSSTDMDLITRQENCWVKDFITYGNFYYEWPEEGTLSEAERRLQTALSSIVQKEDALTALREGLTERGLAKGRIAIDEMNVTPSVHKAIQERLPGVDIVDGYAMLRAIRAVKTPEELKRLEEAAGLTEKALARAVGMIHEGVTESEIAQIFLGGIVEQSAIPTFWVFGGGYRSFFSNATPTDYRLKRGDLMRYDTGCRYKSYCSDTARTLVLGKPTEKQRRYYDAVKAGQDRALELVRPGVRASEIFQEVVGRVREAGIPDYRRGNHVGHGIGIEPYDPPVLSPTCDQILEEGMVLCVEVPYYEAGFGGITVEDMLVVTETGHRMLTKADRNLIVR